jgi:hypothetical protein
MFNIIRQHNCADWHGRGRAGMAMQAAAYAVVLLFGAYVMLSIAGF